MSKVPVNIFGLPLQTAPPPLPVCPIGAVLPALSGYHSLLVEWRMRKKCSPQPRRRIEGHDRNTRFKIPDIIFGAHGRPIQPKRIGQRPGRNIVENAVFEGCGHSESPG